MANSSECIRKSFHTMLTQAEIDLEMWLAMREARRSDDIVLMLNRGYGRFYMAAENALFNSLITILYAVFERRSGTANFWKLKETLREDADPSVLRDLETDYTAIKQKWKRIEGIRNEVVSHQTLKRTVAESHKIAGMTLDDIEGMVRSCQELLFRIASVFYDTHVVFNLKGADSFNKLIPDLRSIKSTIPNPLRVSNN